MGRTRLHNNRRQDAGRPGGSGWPGGGAGGGGGGLIDKLRDGLGDLGLGGIGGGGDGGGGDGGDGGLPGRIADLIDAKAAVGFQVNTGASLVGGAVWVLGVLIIALAADRRALLPRALDRARRLVQPAVSSLVAVLVLAVAAGLAAGAYAAIGDDHPRRVLGGALLGAPNGVWLGLPLGLFVPWRGTASGVLTHLLPDPVDRLLAGGNGKVITVGRMAELDGRVWLLAVAAALAMLLAGVFTAVRTPRKGVPVLSYALRCALPLAGATALALPLLVRLTHVSADAGLSVFGFDAVGASVELRGSVPMALALGAVWGAAAGLLGALLACATGAAGHRAMVAARPPEDRRDDGYGYGYEDGRPAGVPGMPEASGPSAYGPAAYGTYETRGRGRRQGQGQGGYGPAEPGPYTPSPVHRPPHAETNPYLRPLPPSRPAQPPAPAQPPPSAQPSQPPQWPGAPQPPQPPGPQEWPGGREQTEPSGQEQAWPPEREQPGQGQSGQAQPPPDRYSAPTVSGVPMPPPARPRKPPRRDRYEPPGEPPPPGRPGGRR
ncbi:streptophobe family protein [Streptomyces sp. MST-110588]|uniref:streptophobe family protein n=1 Tax=Streptomyces sp. MST-110588 TaxID=2833628 RepID=UPI003242132B